MVWFPIVSSGNDMATNWLCADSLLQGTLQSQQVETPLYITPRFNVLCWCELQMDKWFKVANLWKNFIQILARTDIQVIVSQDYDLFISFKIKV